jgi:hypothetical protein
VRRLPELSFERLRHNQNVTHESLLNVCALERLPPARLQIL